MIETQAVAVAVSEHTSGKMTAVKGSSNNGADNAWGTLDADGYHVCDVWADGPWREDGERAYEPEANARRLCAAWNICQAQTTERIESDYLQGFDPWEYAAEADANVAKLQAEVAEYRAALAKFADMDTVDQGNQNLNGIRDKFLKFCPEYIGYCRAALGLLEARK